MQLALRLFEDRLATSIRRYTKILALFEPRKIASYEVLVIEMPSEQAVVLVEFQIL